MLSLCLAAGNMQAEKLENMVIVNIGEWQYQQNNPGYESNQCFWNTLNDCNLDGTTYEAKNTDNPTGAEQPYLLDYQKNTTTLSIKTSDAFAGINRNSSDAFPSGGAIYRFDEIPELGFHCAVLNGSFFVSDDMDDEGALRLSGFDTGYAYNLYVFCSGARGTDASVNLATQVTVSGANSQTATQDANGNKDQLLAFTGMIPTAEGTMEIRMRAGEENEASLHLAFINSVFIESGEVQSGVTGQALLAPRQHVEVLGDRILVKNPLTSLDFYDLSGKRVDSHTGVAEGGWLPTDGLRPGIYMLRAVDEAGGMQTVKFVKR